MSTIFALIIVDHFYVTFYQSSIMLNVFNGRSDEDEANAPFY